MRLSPNIVLYYVTEVILFTRETCGACATQREKNDGLEDEYPNVEFREVGIQKDLETAEDYGVRKTPTTLVYANGEQTGEFIGIVDRNDLESATESATEQSSGLGQRLVDVVRG